MYVGKTSFKPRLGSLLLSGERAYCQRLGGMLWGPCFGTPISECWAPSEMPLGKNILLIGNDTPKPSMLEPISGQLWCVKFDVCWQDFLQTKTIHVGTHFRAALVCKVRCMLARLPSNQDLGAYCCQMQEPIAKGLGACFGGLALEPLFRSAEPHQKCP